MQPNELDLAELKHEFRQLYRDVGYKGALEVAYELITAFNILIEVISEENTNDK